MAEQSAATLVKLGDSDLTLANPDHDVRGSKVFDRNGNDVGEVDGLLIDEQDRRVRFLQVGSGGFLGIAESKRLVPVDAVTGVDEDVHIDTTREKVADSPAYDPDLIPESDYYGGLYDYYGYAPYWRSGYIYPTYPYF